jgi:fumarate reductase subunit C
MWSHMVMGTSVSLGAGVKNAIAMFFEETYLAQVGAPVIALILLFHFVLTVLKMPSRLLCGGLRKGEDVALFHGSGGF